MVRDTSKEAYKKLIDEGRLGPMQKYIYNYIFENDRLTAREISDYTGFKINVVTGRIHELANELKIIRHDGKRECSIGKCPAYQWTAHLDSESLKGKQTREFLTNAQIRSIEKKVLHNATQLQCERIIKTCKKKLDSLKGKKQKEIQQYTSRDLDLIE